MNKTTKDFLQKLLTRPSNLMDKLGHLGLRLFLYRENLYFDADLNGEHNLLARLKDLGFDAKIIFDIGANVGRWTEASMKLWPQSNYYLFDPTDAPCKVLREKFASNANVNIFEMAVGARNQKIAISANAAVTSHSYVTVSEDGSGQMISGGDLLSQTKVSEVDFCKIDAEGFDLKIMASMKEHLVENRYKIIQFEHYPFAVNYGMKLSEILKLFRDNKYSVGKIFPEGLRDVTHEGDEWSHVSGTNFVAFSANSNELFRKLITR